MLRLTLDNNPDIAASTLTAIDHLLDRNTTHALDESHLSEATDDDLRELSTYGTGRWDEVMDG